MEKPLPIALYKVCLRTRLACSTGKYLFLAFVILSSLTCPAQNDFPGAQDWQDISAQHESGFLSDTLYLNKAQELTERSFKDPALKDHLGLYRKIAWKELDYQRFRVRYYAFLANHSSQLHQEGFAIYYLEKMEGELKKIKPYYNSLNQPRLLLSIYGGNERANEGRRMTIIDGAMPFLKSLPTTLSKQQVPVNTYLNAFTILKHASQLYLLRKDTARVFEVLHLSRSIWRNIENKKGLDKAKLAQCHYALYLTECAGSKILGAFEKERTILNTAYHNLDSDSSRIAPLFKKPLERTILGRLIDYHIDQRNLDSANYYFRELKSKITSQKKSDTGDGTKVLIYSGKINALNNHYKQACQDLVQAYELNDSIISIKMADIHNNMYASLIAEQTNEALLVAEKEKGIRNMYIFVIVVTLIVAVVLFMRKLRLTGANARRQLSDLNKVTQIQIAELEANASLVQKKMGMELHDGVAGRLVNVFNFVEIHASDERDPEKRALLTTIGEMVKDAYINTRSKSHEWYYTGQQEEQNVFSQRVFKIVDQALPDRTYKKQIEIDDQSLVRVSSEMRINLLRIIQEVVANILKHAKASSISLFLYEEDGSVAMQITDNGKGFDTKSRSKGFGLESLRSRMNEMKGSMIITSSKNGTELLFTIPFNS